MYFLSCYWYGWKCKTSLQVMVSRGMWDNSTRLINARSRIHLGNNIAWPSWCCGRFMWGLFQPLSEAILYLSNVGEVTLAASRLRSQFDWNMVKKDACFKAYSLEPNSSVLKWCFRLDLRRTGRLHPDNLTTVVPRVLKPSISWIDGSRMPRIQPTGVIKS